MHVPKKARNGVAHIIKSVANIIKSVVHIIKSVMHNTSP